MSEEGNTTRRSARSVRKATQQTLRLLTRVFPPEPESIVLDGRRLVIGREAGKDGFVLADDEASRKHAALEFVANSGVYRIRDLESSNGTFLDGSRVESGYLSTGSVLRIGNSLFVYSQANLLPGMPTEAPAPGHSVQMAVAEHLAELSAMTGEPILINGPTGAGKERMARFVHERSRRRGPLVAVNCATFNRDLLGSELFGHVQGAFPGATTDRKGLFVEADGGTLFLDEIADLPAEQQPAFLRVLQDGRLRPVGSDRDIDVDVRIISATHGDLDAMQKSGTFRADLYARLAGVVIALAGLDERKEEILGLFAEFTTDVQPRLTVDAAESLLVFSWSRNVRQLQKVASHVKLFASTVDEITLDVLPPEFSTVLDADEPSETATPSRDDLVRMLTESKGNVADVCRETGKHRAQVYRWFKQYTLDPGDYR